MNMLPSTLLVYNNIYLNVFDQLSKHISHPNTSHSNVFKCVQITDSLSCIL